MSYYKIQSRLATAGYYKGKLDGLWGDLSDGALNSALRDAALWRANADPKQQSKNLTEADLVRTAEAFNLEVAHLKAIIKVESNGGWFEDVRKDILDLDGPGGFLDGEDLPKILFEAHHFGRLTDQAYTKTHPNISSRFWNKKLYKGGQAEYIRLYQAMELNREAALKSTSWGLFQIMGFNHSTCGYDLVEDFVTAMKQSEFEQLNAAMKFIEAKKLLPVLRKNDWAKFAEVYNGSGYKANKYDTKLAEAYKEAKGV